MVKNIYLNIDDDIKKALRKIKLERASELTLIVPKQALLFSDFADLKQFKQEVDQLNKHVAIVTNDTRGQIRAQDAGFEVRPFELPRKAGASMDFKRKSAVPPLRAEAQVPSVTAARQPAAWRPAARQPAAGAAAQSVVKPEPVLPAVPPKPLEQPPQPKQLEYPQPLTVKTQPVQQPAPSAHDVLTGPRDSSLLRKPAEPKQPVPIIPPYPQAQAAKQTVKRRGSRILSFFKIFVIAAVIVLILLVTVILPQANVIVYARTQPIVRDFTVTVSHSATAASPQQFVIPGQLLDADEQLTQQFQASGQTDVGNPARGAVQLYNFTRQTYKLGATTTMLTVGNKTYHLAADVVGLRPTTYIPGTKTPDPRSLIAPVQIVADQPGDNSNLPGGTLFEIHNQVLGSLPQVLYAKNTDPISGGSSRFRTEITQQDLDTAKKALAEELISSVRQKMETSKGLTILDSGTNMQIKNISFDKNAGDQALNFTGTINAHVTALAFDPTALRNLIQQRISLTLDPDKYLVTGQKERITEDFRNADLNAGDGTLAVHYESLVASRIDTKGIASKINGKNALEIKEMLLSDSKIEGVDITFKPFWVTSVPKFSGKVYVSSQLQTP